MAVLDGNGDPILVDGREVTEAEDERMGEWARSTVDLEKRDQPGRRDDPAVLQARIGELRQRRDADPERG